MQTWIAVMSRHDVLRLIYIRRQIERMTVELRMNESMTTVETKEVLEKLEKRLNDRAKSISLLSNNVDDRTRDSNESVPEPDSTIRKHALNVETLAESTIQKKIDIIDLTESSTTLPMGNCSATASGSSRVEKPTPTNVNRLKLRVKAIRKTSLSDTRRKPQTTFEWTMPAALKLNASSNS